MPEPDYELLREIALAAERHNVDPAIIAGIVAQESNFDPEAVGDAGMSFGLMQLHLRGAGAGFTGEELLVIEKNLELGTAYLRHLLNHTPDEGNALSAYNQGLGGWQQRGIINQGYVDKVLGYAEMWRGQMRETAMRMHFDAAWGHAQALEQLLTVAQWMRGWIIEEMLAAKRAAGLE